LSGTQAAFLVMFGLLALVAGIVFVARATAVLTVTTVPPGANVLLDGVPLGLSPIQKRVRTGSHVVELALDNYEPFKEVIDVPAGGLPFLQPLQKKPPPPPPPPTGAEIAIELYKGALAAKEAGDYELAKRKLDEALKLSPGMPAALSLMKDVDIILSKRSSEAKQAEIAAANSARMSQARVLASEGRRLYDQGSLGPAKEKLYASLKLDANNPEPHRTLGRIFNREEQTDKVRYHLQRYIELGGADADFKVREWLKTHPKK
jgi:tetratricopeptide (TPR) repeat protein